MYNTFIIFFLYKQKLLSIKYLIQDLFIQYNLFQLVKSMSAMKLDDLSTIDLSVIIDPKCDGVLKKFNVTEPIIKCKGGFVVSRVCTNQNCQKQALVCNNMECEQCINNHLNCHSALFKSFSTLLKKRQDYQKSFFEKIYLIDNEIIQKIQKSNEQMAKTIAFGSFEPKYMKQIQQVYVNKSSQHFKGKEAKQLHGKLLEKFEADEDRQAQLQKAYFARSNQLIDEDIQFKNQVFKTFLLNSTLKKPEQQKWFIDSPLIKTYLATSYANNPLCYKNREKFGYCYFQAMDPDRLAFDKDRINFLQVSVGNPKSAKLIFRASDYAFSAGEFHTKCNGVGNTLTIIRTEFGKTIFAYAAQPWSSANAHVNDTTGKSCIILLDLKLKCPVTTTATNSIFCSPTYGPTFGSGHDIHLADKCNINKSSYCNFPHGYTSAGFSGQASHTLICGSHSDKNFSVVEYQVFQLNY